MMIDDVERGLGETVDDVLGLAGPRQRAPGRRLVKIGEGFQYTVYDLGNGRVLKTPTRWLECAARVFAWRFPFREAPLWSLPGEVRRIRSDAVRSLERIQPLLPHVAPDLGNPVFYSGLAYEQDRAASIEDYFRSHTLAENKAAIDQYIALLFRFWSYGFNDRPFKFNLNFGVNENGKVILLDLGELYFEKEKALVRIAARLWEQVPVRDPALNAYYRSAMDAAMTIENVEACWRSAL